MPAWRHRRAVQAGVLVLLVGLTALIAWIVVGSGGSGEPKLTVLAASSLTDAFPKIDASDRYSFGGSDILAAQIEQGAPADVYAAASPKFPQELYAKGLVLKPVPFASNELVLITPASSKAGVHSVSDLCRQGIKVVIGDRTVPIGTYTRQVLEKLDRRCVLSHVVSDEQNVRDILTKIVLGEADAGFVYRTDARAVPGKVKTIMLPASGQATVQYEIAVVAGSHHLDAARAFVAEVLAKAGQRQLADAGFGPPKPTVVPG
jgi:molybdate transport system substrate-binding protein